ncbi:MAG TPA: hypothetical protein VEF55_13030 [Candidatus Binatia bacterium]|nr:hypothetical protein [Candidatus Binatia bacterium]
MLRRLIVAVAFAVCTSPVHALEPSELIGDWDTWWANAPGQEPDGGGPMRISADTHAQALDGVLPAPGFDGVMNGEVEQREDGALVWNGRWASIWAEGTTTGTFSLIFTDAHTFTGKWSTDDGEVDGAAWNGQRAR